MIIEDRRNFYIEEAIDNKHGPEVYYEMDRQHPITVLANGMLNGQPYAHEFPSFMNTGKRRPRVKTRIHGTDFEICTLPTVRIKRDEENTVQACFEFPYDAHKTSVLRGKKLMGEYRKLRQRWAGNNQPTDLFDETPKLQCGIEMQEDGFFKVFMGLDMIYVFNELRGTKAP